ncbi:MAG: glucose-1-phosphate cytidylyltransferase [Rhizobiaceae bacterium]
MKAVILAGGLGSRLSEETENKPKPMVEIGGRPILWHIMKIYASQGITDFIICLGYRGYVIKEFFANYFLHMADITIDLGNNAIEVHSKRAENWKVTLVDTGLNTMTGGRLKRIAEHVENETFCMTYGDGVSNVNVAEAIKFHKEHGKLATVTGIRQQGRFGNLSLDDNVVSGFVEKPEETNSWINGGYFVLEPSALDVVDADTTSWEQEPLQRLAAQDELRCFRHEGFWQPMDTLREKNELEEHWQSGNAPWKIW